MPKADASPRPSHSLPTFTRRELLAWLGASATLALGPELAAALKTAEPAAFQPGSLAGTRLSKWPVRTVDPQNLRAILAGWRLEVAGLVERPKVYTFAQLLELPRAEQATDFHCVEGWSVYDVPWAGVQLSQLLDGAVPASGATHVTFHTLGGKYNESLPLRVAREPKTLLAFGAAGRTLPLDHGFPLRLVVPRLLGYKNAKYVERLELASTPLEGYWVREGYDYAGEVPKDRLRAGKY